MEIICIFRDRLVEIILIVVLEHALITETLTMEKEYEINSVRNSLIF